MGTTGADAFTFDTFDFYTKNNADRIIGFDSSQGDTIVVNPNAFSALQGSTDFSFTSVETKKKLRRISKKDYDFVYFEKRGRLYFDGNGSDKNWGSENEGGLVAIIRGKPELSATDIALLA